MEEVEAMVVAELKATIVEYIKGKASINYGGFVLTHTEIIEIADTLVDTLYRSLREHHPRADKMTVSDLSIGQRIKKLLMP